LFLAPASAGATEPYSAAQGPETAAITAIVPYVGFAAGGGSGSVTIEGATNRSLGFSGEVRAGAAINARLALDVNASILTVHESYSFPPGNPVGAIRLTHLYLAASVFPFEDGFYFRAGVGPAWLSATNGFDAPPSSLGASGIAVVGGAGYRLWLSDTAALTFNAEGFLHRYGGTSGTEAVVLNVGFDVYFGPERRRGAR